MKTKKMLYKILFSFLISVFLVTLTYGVIETNIGNQIAIVSGTNRNIEFSKSGNLTKYVNLPENSSIIGNYFSGYYFDKSYGFFKLDWSNNKTENVRIVGTTSKCTDGIGYKLGGKAKSENAGFINFNYNNDNFVYYCNGKLYGKAFSKYIGIQHFEGIGFQILSIVNDKAEFYSNTGVFINDNTEINVIKPENKETIYNFKQEIEDTKESFFYIIK